MMIITTAASVVETAFPLLIFIGLTEEKARYKLNTTLNHRFRNRSKKMKELLKIEDLRVSYYSYRGVVHALNGISIDMGRDEILGLVGETGCGKSTVGLSIVGLVPSPGRIDSGTIFLEGEDLTKKNGEEMRELRRTKLALIFQDPSSSLNPVLRVSDQLVEALVVKRKLGRSEASEMALKLLSEVGISNPDVAHQYPHELSGGMKQRVMIAMALTGDPKLLIADEPTSSLDVTMQAQIMELLLEIGKRKEMGVILITHNMGLIAQFCERVAVMYAGNIAEVGSVRKVLKSPMHPYTRGLVNAVRLADKNNLSSIPGIVPDLINITPGCAFAPRCGYVMDACSKMRPPLTEVGEMQQVACHLYEDGRGPQ
jgi:oligopeptide/dipeptide ABC transporter ATP-binding protein